MPRVFGVNSNTPFFVLLGVCLCAFVRQDIQRPLLLLLLIGFRQDEHFLCSLTKDDESTFLPQ